MVHHNCILYKKLCLLQRPLTLEQSPPIHSSWSLSQFPATHYSRTAVRSWKGKVSGVSQTWVLSSGLASELHYFIYKTRIIMPISGNKACEAVGFWWPYVIIGNSSWCVPAPRGLYQHRTSCLYLFLCHLRSLWRHNCFCNMDTLAGQLPEPQTLLPIIKNHPFPIESLHSGVMDPHTSLFFFFFSFGSTRLWTQDLMLARQVLLRLEPLHQPPHITLYPQNHKEAEELHGKNRGKTLPLLPPMYWCSKIKNIFLW
jgi:hypothetical protein